MSVTIVYQTTCCCNESFETGIMQSLAFIADFLAVASVATKTSNVAMSGNYEEASGSSKPCKSAAVLRE